MQYGPGSLDNSELLSLFVSVGSRDRSSLGIARDLLKKYGGLGAIGAVSARALASERGIGAAKAATMVAAYELGVRVAREQINAVPLDTPELIYQFFSSQLMCLPQEQLLVVTVDTRLRHQSTTVVSIGGVNETAAHPREILRPVIARAGYGFIMLHNHPSGDPSPSRADYSVTTRIVEAANLMEIRFVDHLIIGRAELGRNPYFSFREAGVIG